MSKTTWVIEVLVGDKKSHFEYESEKKATSDANFIVQKLGTWVEIQYARMRIKDIKMVSVKKVVDSK